MLIFCAIGSVCVFAAGTQPTMVGDYYQIKTAANLEWFGDYVKAGNQNINAVLCNDIDISTLSNRSTIIGNDDKPFKGIFDGQGYTINGLSLKSVNTDGKKSTGLFGALDGATVKNFTLNGSISDDTGKTPDYIGAVAGRGKGNACIYGVMVNVNITEGGDVGHVGGIVGSSQILDRGTLTIEKCMYNGTIDVQSADDCIGGIIGYANENVYIRNCGSRGTIYTNHANARVGGILGYINNSDFKELYGCYSAMDIYVTSGNDKNGEIIGYLNSAGSANIDKNVCNNYIAAFGNYTGSTFKCTRLVNWADAHVYLNDATAVWKQNLGINDGYPFFASDEPDYDLKLHKTSGMLANYKYDENGILTLLGGGTCTLTMKEGVTSTQSPLIISTNEPLTLNCENIKIDCSGGSAPAIHISRNTTYAMSLNFNGENILIGAPGCAAIQNDSDLPVTVGNIGSTGTLVATGGTNAAGIGGGNQSDAGILYFRDGATITANGGENAAGIGGGYYGDGGHIYVYGGNITANGGTNAAGIGGGYRADGGTIRFSGGTVTANGGESAAGIGGGYYGDGGTVTVSGGNITANGNNYGAGIGKGQGGNAGTFSTGENGNAFIIASSITDASYKTSETTGGIIIEDGNGAVYGTQTLTKNFTLESGKTFTIPEDSTLTVADGVTFTNNGTVNLDGTLILPEGTAVDETLLSGFTGSGVIIVGENTYRLQNETVINNITLNNSEQDNVTVDFVALQNATLIVASYTEDNRLIDTKSVDVTANDTYKIFTLSITKAKRIKAFLWNNMEGMMPLCEEKPYTIEQN